MNTLRNRVAGLLVAVAALLVATPSLAAATGAPPPIATSTSTLILTLNPGEHATPAARRVLLQCQPAGGDHPSPAAACGQLAGKGGNVEALNVFPGKPCVVIYAPVTVTATGTWHGTAVRYRETFGNPCTLHARTGAVFQF